MGETVQVRRGKAKRCPLLGGLLYRLYGPANRALRQAIINCLDGLEHGTCFSATLRAIYKDYHDIEIGLYTQWLFFPSQVDPHTTIGRYCSIARTLRVFNTNHPVRFRSTHAFFFNPGLGYVPEYLQEYTPLTIGHDVWTGHGVIVLPRVTSIGTGAVIGAGTVVTEDVPPFAVVVGNPGRVVHYRFSEPTIESILSSRWWETPVEELDFAEFTRPYPDVADDGSLPATTT